MLNIKYIFVTSSLSSSIVTNKRQLQNTNFWIFSPFRNDKNYCRAIPIVMSTRTLKLHLSLSFEIVWPDLAKFRHFGIN